MKRTLWFDMDGTIYDLYHIPNWLDRIEHEDMEVFNVPGNSRKSLDEIRKIAVQLQSKGWTIGVITWAPKDVKNGTFEFFSCAQNKIRWLNDNFPELVLHFTILEYGTDKGIFSTRDPEYLNVLVDDNAEVRKQWRTWGKNYKTINAKKGYVAELKNLLAEA